MRYISHLLNTYHVSDQYIDDAYRIIDTIHKPTATNYYVFGITLILKLGVSGFDTTAGIM